MNHLVLFFFGLIGIARAEGRGLGDLSEGLMAIIAAAAEALSYVFIIGGIAFLIGAVVQYKAHRDNPSQVHLSKPLFYLLFGGALIALPFAQYIVGYNPQIF